MSPNKFQSSHVLLLLIITIISKTGFADVPEITGTPEIDTPQLLNWPLDIPSSTPDLSEPTSNRIYDLHAHISHCDDTNIVLSTAGNYHMALRDLWYDYYLPKTAHLVRNWYYTTSPPISVEQIQNKSLTFGNIRLECTPSIAVGPEGLMDQLTEINAISQQPIAVIRNYGSVLLVKKGNPKHIKNIWDLGRENIRLVTSNPDSETGSFSNYSKTIYNIALNDPHKPPNWTADRLFNVIFNNARPGKHQYDRSAYQNKKQHKKKWLAGSRIHHREVPWSVAYGKADAGILFYHIALYMVRTFPDLFEIIPLGGTVDFPEPLEGNQIATMYITRIAGDFNYDKLQAREELIDAYLSVDFDIILEKHGLRRPIDFSR